MRHAPTTSAHRPGTAGGPPRARAGHRRSSVCCAHPGIDFDADLPPPPSVPGPVEAQPDHAQSDPGVVERSQAAVQAAIPRGKAHNRVQADAGHAGAARRVRGGKGLQRGLTKSCSALDQSTICEIMRHQHEIARRGLTRVDESPISVAGRRRILMTYQAMEEKPQVALPDAGARFPHIDPSVVNL